HRDPLDAVGADDLHPVRPVVAEAPDVQLVVEQGHQLVTGSAHRRAKCTRTRQPSRNAPITTSTTRSKETGIPRPSMWRTSRATGHATTQATATRRQLVPGW